MTTELLEELADTMENATEVEREEKFHELFPKAKVTITKVEIEQGKLGRNWKYRVTLTNEGKRTGFTFHDSINDYEKGIEPTVIDVLYSVVSDAQAYHYSGGLDDFMSEFGYEDYREGSRVFNACGKEFNNLVRVFGNEGLEKLDAITRGF